MEGRPGSKNSCNFIEIPTPDSTLLCWAMASTFTPIAANGEVA